MLRRTIQTPEAPEVVVVVRQLGASSGQRHTVESRQLWVAELQARRSRAVAGE